jgi:hypothetical protein
MAQSKLAVRNIRFQFGSVLEFSGSLDDNDGDGHEKDDSLVAAPPHSDQ